MLERAQGAAIQVVIRPQPPCGLVLEGEYVGDVPLGLGHHVDRFQLRAMPSACRRVVGCQKRVPVGRLVDAAHGREPGVAAGILQEDGERHDPIQPVGSALVQAAIATAANPDR